MKQRPEPLPKDESNEALAALVAALQALKSADDMRAFLQDDYRVTMVSSGKDAIEFLIHNQPDAILLDYVMPLFNGPSVLKIIRSKEKTRHIPVFFLTGQKDRDTVIECLSLNPAGYFVKPIEKDTLLEKLNSYFNKRA